MTVAVPGTLLQWVALRQGDEAGAADLRDEVGLLLGDRAHDGFPALQIAFLDATTCLRAGDSATAVEILGFIVSALNAEGTLYPTSIYLAYLGLAQVGAGDLDAAARTVIVQREVAAGLQSDVADATALLLEHGRPTPVRPSRPRRSLDAEAALTALMAAGIRAGRSTRWRCSPAVCSISGTRPEPPDCSVPWRRSASSTVGWGTFHRHQRPERGRRQHDPRSARCRGHGAAWLGATLTIDAAVEQAMTHGTRSHPRPDGPASRPPNNACIEQVRLGRTNPEIADALFMARSTVKTHVSHGLTKLGVSTRAEASCRGSPTRAHMT